MNFHLEFPITPFKNKISYSDKLMFIGSCFSENIAEKLQQAKFNVNSNPNGILYDPLSIAKALKRFADNDLFKEDDLFYANETWNSWEHHSRFSRADKADCVSGINSSISFAHNQLMTAKFLFITFGSAFSYTLNKGNIAVANCHKVAHKEFSKSLIKVDTIVSEYQKLISGIRKINQEVNIVFTVSPVRYIRDGVVENNLSKAILIQSVHELVKETKNVIYFPAYELVTDDLRDYRFYNADLVHPNELAVEYVFEKLISASFDEQAKQLFDKIKEIKNAQLHRPFNEDSEAHKKFRATYVERCKQLGAEFPFLDLENEIRYFKS